MHKLEQIKAAVAALTEPELTAFREWFVQFDADAWDRQIEADVKAGRLNALTDQAREDHRNGRCTEL